ncbi:MAG: hypothetical protein A2Y75_00195 [Candidatus Solincola sediminis]|uniref:UspA domain-containing protein n=1 Tax=Candidatus Solincola sediminis TaxID=1797199 RepID=A0A1F2WPZ1_9ACTN|nr:MAG: hypothetical protein A2Y75_00195 [Candidatus Solincola sediminis]
MFWAGLGSGLGVGVLCLLVLFFINKRHEARHEAEGAYAKVLLAVVQSNFSHRAVNMAVRMAGRKGMVETLYVIEIGVDRPLEVTAEDEVAVALRELELASYVGRRFGKRLIPRLEKARMASKVILDTQAEQGFDLLIMDLGASGAMEAATQKIARYVKENADCTVAILSGKQGS